MRNNELFASLSDEELARLAPLCSELDVPEDSVLFFEGRNASHIYLVAQGKIALQKSIRVPHARHSRRTTVTFCYPGEVVGWSALVEPYKYTLSAVAWEHSKLVSIDAKLLRKALEIYPVMGYKVMTALSAVTSRRLRQTTDALINERENSFYNLKSWNEGAGT